MHRLETRRLAPLLAALALFACGEPPVAPPPATPPIGQLRSQLDAFCTVDVEGTGVVDIEDDYVAHVVQCENGAADYQALKAQAVAARSYLYYRLQTGDGTIRDGQVDQVYSCNRNPTEEQRRAARETAGQVLAYRDVLIAGFYVAGAIPTTETCVPGPDDRDPTNTERYVTYNQGRSGDELEQTSLGWINPGNLRNRGCKSQNGANCLSRRGWDYVDILHFYYGADIELVQAVGPCVPEPAEPDAGVPDAGMVDPADAGVPDGGPLDASPPDATPPDAGVALDCPAAGGSPAIVDDSVRCFSFGCQTGEWGVGVERGFNGGMLMAPTIDADESDCVGRWQGAVRSRGEYDLAIYIEPGGQRTLSRSARYHIAHADGEDSVTLDQRTVDGWAPLGRFTFDPAQPVVVWLGDATGEPFSPEGPRVAFDALRIAPPGTLPPTDAGPPDMAPPPADAGPPDMAPPVDSLADEADGCRAAPGSAPSGPWWLALLGVVLCRGARRR